MNEMNEVNKVNRALGAQNKGGSSNEIQLEWIGFQGIFLQDIGSSVDGRKQLMVRKCFFNTDNIR